MGIFQRGSPMVSVKKSLIFSSVVFSKIGPKIMFSNGVERKDALRTTKISIFLSPKNWYFPKGLSHGFGQKVDNFF